MNIRVECTGTKHLSFISKDANLELVNKSHLELVRGRGMRSEYAISDCFPDAIGI